MRTDHWKLICYPHGDGGPQRHLSELYDLQHDPHETRNLINDPGQTSNIEQLSSQLAELMAATGITDDKMPLDEGIKEKLPDKTIR